MAGLPAVMEMSMIVESYSIHLPGGVSWVKQYDSIASPLFFVPAESPDKGLCGNKKIEKLSPQLRDSAKTATSLRFITNYSLLIINCSKVVCSPSVLIIFFRLLHCIQYLLLQFFQFIYRNIFHQR
jgi:hypothetical protein